MLRVVTLHTGTKYGVEYVTKLYKGLARQISGPMTFEVITKSKYPGWWGKLEIFPAKERTIFLDLDLVITGNLDFLFEYDGPFCAWKDPWAAGLNSSVMSIAPGFGANIISEFESNSAHWMKTLHSDQNFLNLYTVPDYWPVGKVKSYKADSLQDGPGGAAIVVFHGEPKPHQLDGWVKEAW